MVYIVSAEATERPAAVMAAMLGADIVRVHDVVETLDAIAMVKALGEVV